MATNISAQVVFQGKLRFTGKIDGLPQELSIDYRPPLGERAGFTGLETLLLALAGCSGQTVVYVLGKMKQAVDRMDVRVSGKRRDEHPTILTAIDLTFVVSGATLQADKVAQAIRAAEEQYCPVWAMLKGGTPIHSSFQIVSAGRVEAPPDGATRFLLRVQPRSSASGSRKNSERRSVKSLIVLPC